VSYLPIEGGCGEDDADALVEIDDDVGEAADAADVNNDEPTEQEAAMSSAS